MTKKYSIGVGMAVALLLPMLALACTPRNITQTPSLLSDLNAAFSYFKNNR